MDQIQADLVATTTNMAMAWTIVGVQINTITILKVNVLSQDLMVVACRVLGHEDLVKDFVHLDMMKAVLRTLNLALMIHTKMITW